MSTLTAHRTATDTADLPLYRLDLMRSTGGCGQRLTGPGRPCGDSLAARVAAVRDREGRPLAMTATMCT